MINKFRNFLCIFAHPDDEVLSAGGTINKPEREKIFCQCVIEKTKK